MKAKFVFYLIILLNGITGAVMAASSSNNGGRRQPTNSITEGPTEVNNIDRSVGPMMAPRLFLDSGENGSEMVRCRGPQIQRLVLYNCLSRNECEALQSEFRGTRNNRRTKYPEHLRKLGTECPSRALRRGLGNCMETDASLGLVECVTNFGGIVHLYLTLGVDWRRQLLTPPIINGSKIANQKLIRTTVLRAEEGSHDTEAIIDSDSLYVNESIKVGCRMSQFFSNNFLKVRGLRANGTTFEINTTTTRGNGSSLTIKPGELWFNNFLTDEPIKIDSDTVGFACATQFHETNEWIEDIFLIQPQKDRKRPKIEKSGTDPHRNFVYGSENVDLLCNATGTPAPKIIWFLNNDKMSLWTHSSVNTQGNLTMSILRVNRIDKKSLYTCVAQNSFGNDTMDINIDVYRPSKPRILEKLRPGGDQRQIFMTGQGRSGRPTCQASGAPTPQIRWLHNGENFLEHITTINGSKVESILAWQVMNSEIEGNYTCIAHNGYGTDVLEFDVQFNEEPQKTGRAEAAAPGARKLPIRFVDILEKMKSAMTLQNEQMQTFFQKMINSVQELERADMTVH